MSAADTKVFGHVFDTVGPLGYISGSQQQSVKIFTDGSGGIRTKDRRLRRCGWAWVVSDGDSDKIAAYGARGALGGVQTVPRANVVWPA